MAKLKGIYVLTVLVGRDKTVKIGSLGQVRFKAGFYAYVGSAQNNLEKRLKRHFGGVTRRRFWHIDYLLTEDHVNAVKAFFKEASKPEECLTAQELAKFGFPVDGFGCSDCKCRSHLFMFESQNLLEKVCLELGFKQFPLSCQ
ncbi:MAG: GIY-YIG nuclease family protein [Candidatus Bathyarchaeia archaeon]